MKRFAIVLTLGTILVVSNFAFAQVGGSVPEAEKTEKNGYSQRTTYKLNGVSIDSDIPMAKPVEEADFLEGKRAYINEYSAFEKYGGLVQDRSRVRFFSENINVNRVNKWVLSELESCTDNSADLKQEQAKWTLVQDGQNSWNVAEFKEVSKPQTLDPSRPYNRVYQRCRVFFNYNETSGRLSALSQSGIVIMIPKTQENLTKILADLNSGYWPSFTNDFRKILASFR